jgi:hypothetical protein
VSLLHAHGSSRLQLLGSGPENSSQSGSLQVASKKSCHALHSTLGTEHNGGFVGAGVVGAGVVGASDGGVVGAAVVGASVVAVAWSLSLVKNHTNTEPITNPTPTPTAKAQRIGVQPYLVAQDGGWSQGLW